MQFLTREWNSFSTVVGGGALGKAAGIALGTMTQVGLTREVHQNFIEMYRQAGGIITGIVVGTFGNGIISEYLSPSCNGIGKPGKRTDIGNGIIPGGCSGQVIGSNLEITNRSIHNKIVLTLVVESLTEGGGKRVVGGSEIPVYPVTLRLSSYAMLGGSRKL